MSPPSARASPSSARLPLSGKKGSSKTVVPAASSRQSTKRAATERAPESPSQQELQPPSAPKPRAEPLASIAESPRAPATSEPSRPAASTLKTLTSGQTAVLDFERADSSDPLPLAPPSAEAEAHEGAPRQAWRCDKWLDEVEGLEQCLSTALCGLGDVVLEDEAALKHMRELRSKEELIQRLTTNGIAQKLADAMWPKVEILQAGPATASELAAQWQEEGAGDLLYGGLPAFFSGLEPRIGSPDPKVLKDMDADHCHKPDSHVEFTTGNYSVVTTSNVEWKFVVEPETPIRWPVEERLAKSGQSEHMRKLLPADILRRRMERKNDLLNAMGADLLTWPEAVGGRLYTGPLFVKYNGLLRGLDSPVPFLKNSMIQLCCAKEVGETFMGTAKTWQTANGSLPYEQARKELNYYTTTIHVINSFIVKMGKLTKAQPVYRGMSGRIFPNSFWRPNAQGVMGGVEYAFMSTTPDRSVAEQYSQDGFGIIVEIQQGMIDRGADISWLSQYPHEAEILFAPLAGLEMREMRIDTHPLNGQHIIIVGMRISINLTNPTIEQVVAKRKKIVNDMGRGLLLEMRSTLNKKGSNETDAYIKLMEGLMSDRPLHHDATWYNDDACFQDSVNETLRLKREVLAVPTLETKKLEGDSVAQLLGETLATKSKVLELPETLFSIFKQLRTLNLDGFGGLEKLPDSLGMLQQLHTLHLRECALLLTVPVTFGRLLNLSTLNLTSCKELTELTSEIGRLVSLTQLDMSFCKQIKLLPSEVGKLTKLDTLKLQQCTGLTELPLTIGQLVSLRVLCLYGCSSLKTLPEEIGDLEGLEDLNLRSCAALGALPPMLGQTLPNLTSLDLSMCKNLISVPDTLGLCASLQTLFMGNCYNVAELPAAITRLRQLHTLNLYNCGAITFLHDNFQMATALRVLSLQGCEKLKEVPPSLGLAPALTTLTLWNCIALETMPDLTTIPKLQIDGVPEQLAEWEAEQKRKRQEDLAAGRGNKGLQAKAPQGGGWKEAAGAIFGDKAKKMSMAAAAESAMSALGGDE